jgi:uncharacterized protein (DUF697 family)
MAIGAAEVMEIARRQVRAYATKSDARKPFRFLLCGDPAFIAELRAMLLRGHDDGTIPLDAAATLETIDPSRQTVIGSDARCVIFLGRSGDLNPMSIATLTPLKLPVFAVTVDAHAAPQTPPSAPRAGEVAEYVVPALTADALRPRLFPHLIERCKHIEVAVARRLPVLRETVCIKLTRDAASSALKVAAASAVIDHVPVLGLVLGAVASAGDMAALTGIQVALLMQIGSAYGLDPDVRRVWELLPVVGGGLGWRALSRELSGFIPVAGVFVKGAIAYAGTIVVGEGATFYYEHGRHMSKADATARYEQTKQAAMTFARDAYRKFRNRS